MILTPTQTAALLARARRTATAPQAATAARDATAFARANAKAPPAHSRPPFVVDVRHVPAAPAPASPKVPPAKPYEPGMSPSEQVFWIFHEDNPQVYAALVTLAREWIAKCGKRKLGLHMLFQRARWELELNTVAAASETNKDGGASIYHGAFSLNNNCVPYYARLIMSYEPDLSGVFDLRRQKVQATFGPSNGDL